MPPTPPPDAVKEERFRTGARFRRPRKPTDPPGHQRFQLQSFLRPQFVREMVDGKQAWEEPDLSWAVRDGAYRIGRADFRASIELLAPVIRYQSKSAGTPQVTITLTHIGGVPVPVLPVPLLDGRIFEWIDIVPGVDVFVRATLDSIDVRKRIKGPAAPKSFRWHIAHTDGMTLNLPRVTVGQDNFDLSNPGRDGLGVGRTRRRLEMTHAVTNETVVDGVRSYDFEETWTGNTFQRHPVTRALQLRTSGERYPVEIDVLVSEEIPADGDDGYEFNSLWFDSYAASNNHFVQLNTPNAYRFTSVAIPNGATIDDATFAVERASAGTVTTSTFVGSDEDNAGAWSDSNGPTDKTATSATVVGVTWHGTSGTDVSIDVQAIVAEITSRPGWASGNALALYSTSVAGAGYVYLEDEADADAGAARLTVNYTVPTSGPLVRGGRLTRSVLHGFLQGAD